MNILNAITLIKEQIKTTGQLVIYSDGSCPVDGYTIPLFGYEKPIPLLKFDESELLAYIAMTYKELDKGFCLMARVGGGSVWMTIGFHTVSAHNANIIANAHQQKTIFYNKFRYYIKCDQI